MADKLSEWTEPILCTYKNDLSQKWFVYFDFTDYGILDEDGNFKTVRKQYRNKLNSYKTKTERTKWGNALAAMLKAKLEAGWNPIRGVDPTQERQTATIQEQVTIKEAILRVVALKQKSGKAKSIRNYKDISGMFLQWMEQNGYANLPLYKFSKNMGQSYMDYLLLERNVAGITHNGRLGILKGFCNAAMKRWPTSLTVNPFSSIDKLPTDVGKNVAYTASEARALMMWLKLRDPRMHLACQIMFHCMIRKTELADLKDTWIDLDKNVIRMESVTTKNRRQEAVTIPPALKPLLLEAGLDEKRDEYVFGWQLNRAAKKLGRPDTFSDTYLRYRREIEGVVAAFDKGESVYKRMQAKEFLSNHEPEARLIAGIGPEKTLYSWKHTGVVMYYELTRDVHSVMIQCRHADLQTTMVYLKSLGLQPNTPFLNASIQL